MSRLSCRVVIRPPRDVSRGKPRSPRAARDYQPFLWYFDIGPQVQWGQRIDGFAFDALDTIPGEVGDIEWFMWHHDYIGIVADGHYSYHRVHCRIPRDEEALQMVRVEHVLTYGLVPCPACAPQAFGQQTN